MKISSPQQTGKPFEITIADLYRNLGAKKIEHDIELAGNQIDVYVEMECPDTSIHRVAIEAKDWDRTIGIDTINQFAIITRNLRDQGIIDEGIIIARVGFTKQARNAAQTHQIRLQELKDLSSIVSTRTTLPVDHHFRMVAFTHVATALTELAQDSFSSKWHKPLGAIGGSLIGAVIGLTAGLAFSNPLIGLLIGVVVGSFTGWFTGTSVWFSVVSGINIGIVGALIGALIAAGASIGQFARPVDGAMLGWIIGFLIGWLFRDRVVEGIDQIMSGTILRMTLRIILGPSIGSLTGLLLGYGIVERIAAGTITTTMPLVLIIAGLLAGMLLSILIGWHFSQTFPVIFTLFRWMKNRIELYLP